MHFLDQVIFLPKTLLCSRGEPRLSQGGRRGEKEKRGQGGARKEERLQSEANRDYALMVSLKLKGGYTSFAVYESFNGATGFSIESLNGEVDYAVPGQPQFKKTIS